MKTLKLVGLLCILSLSLQGCIYVNDCKVNKKSKTTAVLFDQNLSIKTQRLATEKYSERCGICVPSNTIKPSKKGEIVKECSFRECTNRDPQKNQRLEDGKVFVHVRLTPFLASLLNTKNPVVYREYADKPGQFILAPWEKVPLKSFGFW